MVAEARQRGGWSYYHNMQCVANLVIQDVAPPRALRRPGRGARPPRNGTARRLGSVGGGGPALARSWPRWARQSLALGARPFKVGAWLPGASGIAPAAAGATMAAVSIAIMSSSLVGCDRHAPFGADDTG